MDEQKRRNTEASRQSALSPFELIRQILSDEGSPASIDPGEEAAEYLTIMQDRAKEITAYLGILEEKWPIILAAMLSACGSLRARKEDYENALMELDETNQEQEVNRTQDQPAEQPPIVTIGSYVLLSRYHDRVSTPDQVKAWLENRADLRTTYLILDSDDNEEYYPDPFYPDDPYAYAVPVDARSELGETLLGSKVGDTFRGPGKGTVPRLVIVDIM